MLGSALLVLAIITYMFGWKRFSLFIFFTFMLKGWVVLTDDIMGMKNYDLAFAYTLVILIYSAIFENKVPAIDDLRLRRWLYAFFFFMLLDVTFSYVHYSFTPFQILQGSRSSFLFLSYFFIKKTKKSDLLWLNEAFFYITFITSILYILEVFFDLPVLPYYDEGAKIDDFTGIKRFYNCPPLLYWYLFVSIISPNLIKSRLTFIGSFIFVTALIATLGRTQIAITFGVLALGVIMRGQLKSTLSFALVCMVIAAPFAQTISARFVGRDKDSTANEIEAILHGGIQETVKVGNTKDVGTFTYRLAWVYERAEYLATRSVDENIFGLGLISDSQVLTVQKMYAFNLGLKDAEDNIAQMVTPDISYGNLLSKYGYVGGGIYLMIWIYLIIHFYRQRHNSPLSFLAFLLIFDNIFLSFSGSTISDQGNLAIPFMLYVIISKSVESFKETDNVSLRRIITPDGVITLRKVTSHR